MQQLLEKEDHPTKDADQTENSPGTEGEGTKVRPRTMGGNFWPTTIIISIRSRINFVLVLCTKCTLLPLYNT